MTYELHYINKKNEKVVKTFTDKMYVLYEIKDTLREDTARDEVQLYVITNKTCGFGDFETEKTLIARHYMDVMNLSEKEIRYKCNL